MMQDVIESVHGQGNVNHAVIWLHGLGATASDFPPIVPELGLTDQKAIRFIFPQAPNRPISINGGMVMPGWYDIKGVDIKDKEDAKGMADSQSLLVNIIEKQIASGVPAKNIIVAGFSQGGAVAYHTGLRYAETLAGVLALSTYLVFSDKLEYERSETNLQTPILVNHGSFDSVVPLTYGQMSVDILTSLGYRVEWEEFPMEHQVILPQIRKIGAWINQIFCD